MAKAKARGKSAMETDTDPDEDVYTYVEQKMRAHKGPCSVEGKVECTSLSYMLRVG